jgi:hypothetical protein
MATAMSNQQPTLSQSLVDLLNAFFVPAPPEIRLLVSTFEDLQKPMYQLLTPTWEDVRCVYARLFLPVPEPRNRFEAHRDLVRLNVAGIRLKFGGKVVAIALVLGVLAWGLVFR